ncbi:2'-5' RNA ligase family protein [Caballeronia humi]|uniref:2'-5' RNA ligase n=1 Tax=Caballeronia humi TaxID=326474 RepID=A0A158FPF6_9BURK|nr:2'-5' RNA ligase family protein [Caballeronia humi]SAL21744.1 2'-5' RNA ligase [Caballeronia humi]
MPALTDSLFFAIYPDAAAAERLSRLAERLRAEYGLKGKPAAPDRFHVTLHHLGAFAGVPEDLVAIACAAASKIMLPPVGVMFDRASSFPGRRSKSPFVLRAAPDAIDTGLLDLHAALVVELQATGLAIKSNTHYTPHVTLLYDEHHLPEQAVDPISWIAREFVLVRSLLGRSQYVPLARWPLID